ncbi:AttT protein [Rhodanobacter thiooxydans]|uniref:AttT protein n=1 Tax=Rhodanobacter thiooxydans TaxID=416169 RepID=A0A154QK84_9GAMM|nr:GNAT family N-acetyltransferase [Rhodanobacter thiooxydans]EIM02144.1 GCN5-related N-acetyltransferase [Rhodanobacter thiooxydans LCS2]KZC24255.1 AttT protein [Rhodanobacter thiooxydans]MCW0203513.1 GNAT family N-acetyltransferase [Rhodanobacter thiooxydans]
MSTNDAACAVVHATPSASVYNALRTGAGLSAKSEEVAARGLPGSLFAVQILHRGEPIGMGRIIGDGACFYQVVDIAVLPGHQGKGLGKRIMQEILGYLDANVPPGGYVSLIADGRAQELYARFGFEPTAPAGVGMAYRPRSVRPAS